MKKTVLKIAVLSLAALFFFGCATQSNRADVWRGAEAPNELIGKWEGSVVQQIPKNDDNYLPATIIEITISLEYLRDAARVNGSMKMDFDQFLTDWSNMGAIKGAGMTKTTLWGALEKGFKESTEITVGGEYFITQDISDNVDNFISDGSAQINASGNKMKLLFPEPISLGMGDTGFSEIILNKK
jgi:hypothetical protein